MKRILVSSLMAGIAVVIGCTNSSAQTTEDPNQLQQGGASTTVAPPLVLGQMTSGGNGCNVLTSSGQPTVSDVEISFPIETVVSKDALTTLKRGACAVALPVSVPAGYRMIVDEVSLDADIALASGGSAEGSVEVFVAGTIGDTLDISAKSKLRPKHSHQTLSVDPQLTTECGAAINLRSNSSVVLKEGSGSSSAKLSSIRMSYRLEVCP